MNDAPGGPLQDDAPGRPVACLQSRAGQACSGYKVLLNQIDAERQRAERAEKACEALTLRLEEIRQARDTMRLVAGHEKARADGLRAENASLRQALEAARGDAPTPPPAGAARPPIYLTDQGF